MKTTTRIAAALIAATIASVAHAGEIVTVTGDANGMTVTASHPDAHAQIIHVPQDYSPAARERAARWVAFCKPHVGHVDEYGMEYLAYAHKGCEFGRDH